MSICLTNFGRLASYCYRYCRAALFNLIYCTYFLTKREEMRRQKLCILSVFCRTASMLWKPLSSACGSIFLFSWNQWMCTSVKAKT